MDAARAGKPLRFINGPADPISGAHMAARWGDLVGHDSVVLLEPLIGHWPQLEAPAAVVAAFLKGVAVVPVPVPAAA